MLYSGHFSFDELETGEQRHGYFNCLVDAENAPTALDKMRHRILELKNDENNAFFKNVHVIYLEDLVEIAAPPRKAVITRFQSSRGVFPKSRSYSFPASETSRLQAFQWRPDDAASIVDDEGFQESKPFIDFAENSSVA